MDKLSLSINEQVEMSSESWISGVELVKKALQRPMGDHRLRLLFKASLVKNDESVFTFASFMGVEQDLLALPPPRAKKTFSNSLDIS
jgi:hypothetical protein